jgi:hypothetical protein
MEQLTIDDIPSPKIIKKSGKRICFVVHNPKVFKKLEELGWYWLANGAPSDYCPQPPVKIFLGKDGRLSFSPTNVGTYVAPDNPIEFELIEITSNSNSLQINLKQLNSSPSSFNCASCGAQLKEPYPGLKHCPKCEP